MMLRRQQVLDNPPYSNGKKHLFPKADKRKKLADYFGVTFAYLDGESEYPHGEPTSKQ